MKVGRGVLQVLKRYTKLQHYGVAGLQWMAPYNQVSLSKSGCGFQTLASWRDNFAPASCYCGACTPAFSQGWSHTSQRTFWGWLNAIFNKVDESRIKEVGADRACAEWLLRCGAFVKWQNRENWTKDYNTLPPAGGLSLKIEEVDASASAIMHIGFPHFRGCRHIRRMVFHKATYMDDAALSQLTLLQESLRELQVSSCGNITIQGLRHIKKLKNLQQLLLYDLPEISSKKDIVKELKEALPNCNISFPYAQAKDDPNLQHEEK